MKKRHKAKQAPVHKITLKERYNNLERERDSAYRAAQNLQEQLDKRSLLHKQAAGIDHRRLDELRDEVRFLRQVIQNLVSGVRR